MSDSASGDPRSVGLPGTIANGPLAVRETPPCPGWTGAFGYYSKRLLENPLFPWLGRWGAIGLRLALTYAAFFGARDPRPNFATIVHSYRRSLCAGQACQCAHWYRVRVDLVPHGSPGTRRSHLG